MCQTHKNHTYVWQSSYVLMDSNKTPNHHSLCLLDSGSFCKGYYSRISSCKTYGLEFFFSWFHTQHKVLRYFQRGKRGNLYWYLVALFIATVAAGTPLGICLIIKGIDKKLVLCGDEI